MRARRGSPTLALVLMLALTAGLLPPLVPLAPDSVAHAAGGASDGGDSTPSLEIQGWDLPRVPVELIRRALKRVLEFLEDVLDQWVPGDPPWPPPDPGG